MLCRGPHDLTLAAGTHLGPYRIEQPLGAGGMGEVYRAADTRLDRTVAIKVLPDHLAGDRELRERFEREARAVSSLNHPHICTLYDVGRHEGTDFLVMEYLEGETLAARLSRGRLPLNDTLRYGVEVADALHKAHRQGIVHRDVKPGNVILTKSGAKLLDFGLAKVAVSPFASPGVSSVTMPASPVTTRGTILGTFQYMAPEQLEGREADARSDIFAFGSMLYEMVTGRRAFEGQSATTVISAIMTADPPPLTSAVPLAPAALDHVVRTCLAKDPDERFQSAHDLLVELRWIRESRSQSSLPAPIVARHRVRERIAWTIAGAAVLGITALAAVHFREVAPAVRPVRLQIVAPDRVTYRGNVDLAAISPDGHRVAFTGTLTDGASMLWMRSLESTVSQPLPGTEGAYLPFWSPDSRFVGFFAAGQLKKVDASGGPVQIVCNLGFQGRGGAWSKDGTIVFGSENGPLYRVPASGGDAIALTTLDKSRRDVSHRGPQFLPDGRLLYLVQGGQNAGIYITSVDSSSSQLVVASQSAARYTAGYLLYGQLDTLMAQRFDIGSLKTSGDPFPVAEQVGQGFPGMKFSTSETGVLVYSAAEYINAQLAWYGRDGKRLGNLGEPGQTRQFVISPDQKRIAIERPGPKGTPGDIWVLEIGSGILSPLTRSPADERAPVWSPDGKRIVFSSSRNGPYHLYAKGLGETEEQLLLESDENTYAKDFYGAGRFLLYLNQGGRTYYSLPLESGSKPTTLFKTDENKDLARVSPGGHWVAYGSNKSGRWEIYTARFPTFADQRQLSKAGGMQPRWRNDGQELYYIALDGKMMMVNVKQGTTLETGAPQELFSTPLRPGPVTDQFAVVDNGRRFLIAEPLIEPSKPITVILNWTAALQQQQH